MTTFYRLRTGAFQPSMLPGDLYPYVRDDRVEGYIWLEVNGEPRSVWAGDFEKVEGEQPDQDEGG
jgi:hypothetical protein